MRKVIILILMHVNSIFHLFTDTSYHMLYAELSLQLNSVRLSLLTVLVMEMLVNR